MNIDDFITFFKTFFYNEFSEELTPKTEFRYLDEWSSMTALAFIAGAKIKYNKEVPPLEMKKTETIEELFNLVNSL
jgi:acyl carrier protein